MLPLLACTSTERVTEDLLLTPTTVTKDLTPPLEVTTSTMLFAIPLELETSSLLLMILMMLTMPPLPSMHPLFALTELEDGIAHSSPFHFLDLHSLLPSHTLQLLLISLILSITSTLIFLPIILPTLSLLVLIPQLELESSSIEEMDIPNTALITDMNLLMSITQLLTPTLSTNSIGTLLDESTLEFLAVPLLLALSPYLSTEL